MGCDTSGGLLDYGSDGVAKHRGVVTARVGCAATIFGGSEFDRHFSCIIEAIGLWCGWVGSLRFVLSPAFRLALSFANESLEIVFPCMDVSSKFAGIPQGVVCSV